LSLLLLSGACLKCHILQKPLLWALLVVQVLGRLILYDFTSLFYLLKQASTSRTKSEMSLRSFSLFGRRTFLFYQVSFLKRYALYAALILQLICPLAAGSSASRSRSERSARADATWRVRSHRGDPGSPRCAWQNGSFWHFAKIRHFGWPKRLFFWPRPVLGGTV